MVDTTRQIKLALRCTNHERTRIRFRALSMDHSMKLNDDDNPKMYPGVMPRGTVEIIFRFK